MNRDEHGRMHVAGDPAGHQERAVQQGDRQCHLRGDHPALDVALRSDAFYIGALGSKRTHAGRLERLAGLGHDAPTLERIHGPAGLAIGAVSPAEIALAVMAEMTQVLRQGGSA